MRTGSHHSDISLANIRATWHSPRRLEQLELKRLSLAKRFWPKVKKTGTCWLWTGYWDKKSGYGVFRVNGTTIAKAHRTAWELVNGPITDGLCVLHHCDNRLCVSPDHLFLGTQKDNVQDAVRKGRMNVAQRGKPKSEELKARWRAIALIRAKENTKKGKEHE